MSESASDPGPGPSALDRAAPEVCADVELEPECRPLLVDGMSVGQFITELEQAGHVLDAIKVLARALDAPTAIDWAARCRASVETEVDAAESACLAAAAAWLADPTEERRVAAQDAADAGRYETAGAWVAAAVGWTGGNMSSSPEHVVPPPPHLTAHALAGAIGLAAAQSGEPAEELQLRFLNAGIGIAKKSADGDQSS